MILPLSDAPNPRGVPWVTYGLIAANVAIYLLVSLPLGIQQADPSNPALQDYLEMLARQLPAGTPLQAVLPGISAYDLFVFEHGFRPSAPQLWDLFFSMFLHGGLLHLGGNMLFLWIYGDNVEYRLGRLLYLVAYLATGIVATLFFALFAGRTGVPLVGASGAISGVLGFYFLWFPRNRVRLWIFLFPFLMDTVEVSARLVLGVYLLLDNLLPFLVAGGGAGGGVAHGAHIGGFLAGVAAAWGWDRRRIGEKPREYREPAQRRHASPGRIITDALERGDLGAAARDYFALRPAETRRLLPPEALLGFAQALAREGHPEAALVLFRRHLRDYPNGPGAAEAHLGAALVQLYALGQVAPAYQHLLEVLDLSPNAAIEEQAREALEDIARRQKLSRQ